MGALKVNNNTKKLKFNLQRIESRLKKRKEASAKLYESEIVKPSLSSQLMTSRYFTTAEAQTDNFSLHVSFTIKIGLAIYLMLNAFKKKTVSNFFP